MSLAKVSVVIPCFNYARYVPDAIRSALSQTGVDVEVIVVDDASTDASPEVISAIARADTRVRLVRHDLNTGPVQTFNDGLDLATGEFLVRLDADDLLTPGSLERSVDVCRRFPTVGLVYGHPIHFLTTPPPMRRPRPKVVVWSGSRWLTDRCRTGVNVITSPEALMRMSAVRTVGGQRDLAHAHDMEMWLRLATVADVAYIRGADQAWHREHDRSLSCQAQDPLGVTILRERQAAFDLALGDVAPELHALARRTLAREAVRCACHDYDRGEAAHHDIDELISLATCLDPDVEGTVAWRALAARRAAGERWRRNRPWVLGLRALRMFRRRARQHRWHRTGLYNRLPSDRRELGLPILGAAATVALCRQEPHG